MRFGYARVSTIKQNLARQIKKLMDAGVDSSNIYREKYTGTTLDRPMWNKLVQRLKPGDVVVFEDVSRFSRDEASEAWKLYKELYEKGIELEFISRPHINTRKYKEMVGLVQQEENLMNEMLLVFMKYQIIDAFNEAHQEVENIRKNIAQGIENARREKKNIGRPHKGEERKENSMTKKQALCVPIIREFFERDVRDQILPGNGSLDERMIDFLRGKMLQDDQITSKTLSKGTYYRYKNIALNREVRSYTVTDEHRIALQQHAKEKLRQPR